MVNRGPFHFADRFAAGRTEMTDIGNAIHRPGGMAGWICNATIDGGGSVGGGGERPRFRTRIGDLLLFAPTAVHDYHRHPDSTRWVHLWTYFYPREHWQPWLRWDAIAPGILRLRPPRETWDAVIPLFEQLVAAAGGAQPLASELGMCLLEQILITCHREVGAIATLDPRIAYALEWLAARYERRIRLDDLAAACGMSPSRLSHLFRVQVGEAPMRHLEHLRIDRAREQLVMTGKPITEIATAVGFDDPDWFARVFKRRAGVSPRAFRSRAGGDAS